ncbi:hypothetical protein A4X13_0g4077 [Tilletia indica]|uniref:Uncharacterized protein n=1 Tax=Tilletia indica TaxID=43049 RepID=A0A177TVG4_9BASI|nr:hypothetical protein A4X13_0g4077 [Tilletia indica]
MSPTSRFTTLIKAAAVFCLVASVSAVSPAQPALESRQNDYGYDDSDGQGPIEVNTPTSPLATCTSTALRWQWSGDVTASNTVAIYLQNVAEYSFSARDSVLPFEILEANAGRSNKRMHKVRRGLGGDPVPASNHMLHARAGVRMLASGVSLINQVWVWSKVDVRPALYRVFIVLQGTNQQAVYGSSTIFSILPGADTTCLSSGSSMPVTTADPTWALVPVSSTTSTPAAPVSSAAPSQTATVSTPAPPTAATSTSMNIAVPATTNTTGSSANSTSFGAGSSSHSSGLHGPIIAAVIILPLAALIAIGMGAMHIMKKRREENVSPYVHTISSSDALGGAGAGSTGAWADRFLARANSRDMDGNIQEKSDENRASVFSDVYGGMGEAAAENKADAESAHQRGLSQESMGYGRRSMAEVSLADTPYLHCQSVTPNPSAAFSGRPSMTSLRSMPISSPMPLIVEDRPIGRSFDLSRSTFAAQQTVLSPTESEGAFSAGGWNAMVGKADVEGAHPLSKDEVDVLVGSSSASQPHFNRPLPLPTRLETIPGSMGSESIQSDGAGDRLPLTLMTELAGQGSPEMPYPDTPRPYSIKNVSSGQHERQGSGAQESYPPRSASSMSGMYAGEGGAYATVQRSASNGSTFTIRRKPVPVPVNVTAAAPSNAPMTPKTEGPFSDANAVPDSPSFQTPAQQQPRTLEKDQFPETPENAAPATPVVQDEEPVEALASSSESAAIEEADVAPVMEKKQYKLSVDLSMDPLRFSGF